MEIVGIVGHVRGDREETTTGEEVFVIYNRLKPSSAPLRFVVKLNAPTQLGEILAFTRAEAPGCVVRASALDDRYAQLYGDTQLAGAVLGSIAAVVAGGWIESQLFGVSSTDPATYGFVVLAVFGTSVLAAWHPARRAARVDPATTLRAE